LAAQLQVALVEASEWKWSKPQLELQTDSRI